MPGPALFFPSASTPGLCCFLAGVPLAQPSPPPLYLEPLPSPTICLSVHAACPAVQEPPCLQTDAKMFMRSQMGPFGSVLPTSGPNCSFSPSRRHSTALARTDGQSGWSSQPSQVCFQFCENLSCKLQSWLPGSRAQGQASLETDPRCRGLLSPRGSTRLSLGVVPLPTPSPPCLS